MNNQIKITHDGVDYTLEYDRTVIKMLENAGFKYEEFLEKPMINIELAFTAAFIKHHPKLKQVEIEKIYNDLPNKTEFVAALGKMISDFYDSLLAEPEDNSGKANWEVVDLTPKKTEKSQG